MHVYVIVLYHSWCVLLLSASEAPFYILVFAFFHFSHDTNALCEWRLSFTVKTTNQ